MRHAYPPSLSVDDCLAGELKSDIRHEFVNGEVHAMAGAPQGDSDFLWPEGHERSYAGEAHNLRQIGVCRRAGDRAWSLGTPTEGDPLHLECVGAALSLDEAYEDVPGQHEV